MQVLEHLRRDRAGSSRLVAFVGEVEGFSDAGSERGRWVGLGLEIVSGGASAGSSNTRLQWSLLALKVLLAAAFGPLLG